MKRLGLVVAVLIMAVLVSRVGASGAQQASGPATPVASSKPVASLPYLYSDDPPVLPTVRPGTVAVVATGEARAGIALVIHNNSPRVLHAATVAAEVRDAEGRLFAASTRSSVQPNVVGINRYALAIVEFGEVDDVSELDVAYSVDGDFESSDYGRSDLGISEGEAYRDRFVGIVDNTNRGSVGAVYVMLACFSRTGTNLVVLNEYLDLAVPGNSSRPFQIDFREPIDCGTYLVTVDGYVDG